jgi:transcriptional regulator with XRE-family HTH domain
MTRKELINSKEYWISSVQLDLYNKIKAYLEKNNITQTELANQLNVTKGYISQVLNGNFDHKLSKLVELALACDNIPLVYFVDKTKYTIDDANDKMYELMPMQRPKNMVYEKIPSYTPSQQVIKNKSEEEKQINWKVITPKKPALSVSI